MSEYRPRGQNSTMQETEGKDLSPRSQGLLNRLQSASGHLYDWKNEQINMAIQCEATN